MDLQLTGKKALVTGSTAGIGLAIATALAREGAEVVINGRTGQRVAEAIQKIHADADLKGSVSGIAADAGTRAGTDQLIAQVPDVDILVNNLGIFEPKPFEQIPDEDWRRFFEVNVLSGIRLLLADGSQYVVINDKDPSFVTALALARQTSEAVYDYGPSAYMRRFGSQSASAQ